MGHSGTDYVVIWDRFLFLRFTLILLAIIVTGQVGQGKLYVYTHTHGGARHKGYIYLYRAYIGNEAGHLSPRPKNAPGQAGHLATATLYLFFCFHFDENPGWLKR